MKAASSGFWLKKLPVLVLLLAFIGAAPLFAQKTLANSIRITPPVFGPANPDNPTHVNFALGLNQEIGKVYDNFIDEIAASDFGSINSDPQKLMRGFANSSVFSSSAATQRGYGGYKLFAFTVGTMVGAQLPVSLFSSSLVDDIQNLETKLQDEGDVNFGLNPQAITGQIGINAKFLLDGLYLGFKFGYFNLDMIEDYSFSTFSLGLMANYQLVKQKRFLGPLFLWRGVNIGSGLVYQRTNVGFGMDMGEYDVATEQLNINGHSVYVGAEITDSRANLDFNINTVTIPLEVMTSVRLLGILNLSVGAGIDFGFGAAKLNTRVAATAETTFSGNYDTYVEEISPARVDIDVGGKNTPKFFNPKVMAGLGVGIGPVLLDVPVTIYVGQGYNLGLTFTVVW